MSVSLASSRSLHAFEHQVQLTGQSVNQENTAEAEENLQLALNQVRQLVPDSEG